MPAHFKGKEAISHVIEAQARGIIASSEIHGTEIPGHLSALADSARETSLALLLLSTIQQAIPHNEAIWTLIVFSLAWMIWKMGRASWLAWSRLERLHRIVAEEKWEIEHHRSQEREELAALYQAKGFEGKLLENVLDVLMADNDRLLRVMVEEELGLTLEVHEHPLKQGLGAFLGVFIVSIFCLTSFFFFSTMGMIFSALFMIGLFSILAAYFEKNRLIPAVIWNLGLAILSFGTLYFLLKFLL